MEDKMEDKMKDKWKEICKLRKDRKGNWTLRAVHDGKKLMLQQWPKLITTMPWELRQQVFQRLLDEECHRKWSNLITRMPEELRQQVFQWLLDEEYHRKK